MKNINPDISIIIPVFNAEKYLYDCLNSILNQTFQNFEVLIIDDGSIDNSKEIAKIFTAKNKKFQYFYQENSGVSAARNYGLKISNGNYIVFIDSDDSCGVDYLKDLIKEVNLGYDFVASGYVMTNKENKVSENRTPTLIGKVSQSQCITAIFQDKAVYSCPWNKIYKGELIRIHNLMFDETITYGEDMLFLITYLRYCASFIFIDSSEYKYRRHESNITGNYSLESIDHRLTYLKALKKAENILIRDFPEEMKLIRVRYNDVALSIFRTMYKHKCHTIEKEKLKYLLHENYNLVKEYLNLHDKAKYFLTLHFTSVANFIIDISK